MLLGLIHLNGQSQFLLSELYVGYFLQEKDSIPRQDRWVFDISHERWLESPGSIQQQWYSWGFGFTKMFDFPTSRSFSIALGPGLRSQHFYHNGDFKQYISPLFAVTDSITPMTYKSYIVNKHVLNYADLAIELRLRLGKQHRFKFFAGFRGGYLFNVHSKYIDGDYKFKRYRISGFEKFTYGPTLRIGYGNVCLFLNYRLNKEYENNSGQTLHSFSGGLTFFFL